MLSPHLPPPPPCSSDLLAWCGSRGGSGRYAALRLALHAFLATGMALEALDVHAVVCRGGKTHSLSALAALLCLLFRSWEVRATWKVFEEMAAMGARPSLNTFNALILGFCHMGLVRVGAGLLAVMERFHIVPDACNEANTITFNVLIDGYAKSIRMDEANAACREMKARGLVPDCCTFNILAAGAYKVGKAVQLAHEHQELHEMFGSKISADGLDMLVCRLCWDGQLDDACELLCSTIEQSVPMSIAGFNALVVAYSKEGFGEEAFELYRIMNKICLTPSSPTLNYLIMGLCNQGRLHDAQMLLEHMISKGYCVSTSFTIYLDAYFRSGNVVGALKCCDDTKKVVIRPDFIAFLAYISGLCRLDYVNEAYQAFDELTRRGLVLNNITYNSIIPAFCRVGNVA